MGDLNGLSKPRLSYLWDGDSVVELWYLVSQMLSTRGLSTQNSLMRTAHLGPGGARTSCDLRWGEDPLVQGLAVSLSLGDIPHLRCPLIEPTLGGIIPDDS